MNWGYRIMIVFSLFVTGIIVLVIKSSSQEQQLVTTGYYDKELVYQETIDARRNAASLTKPLQVRYSGSNIHIVFPPEMNERNVDASVHLYFPMDEKQDRKFKVETTSADILINGGKLRPGKYYVKVLWQESGRSYYDEPELFVP